MNSDAGCSLNGGAIVGGHALFRPIHPEPDVTLSYADQSRERGLAAGDVDSACESVICHERHHTNLLVDGNSNLVGRRSDRGVTKILVTTPLDTTTLAARVKEARESLGMSQPELAERVGMSQQGIGAIEAGRSKRPTKLRELARALQRSEAWLLGEDDGASATVGATIPAGAPKPSPNSSYPPVFYPFSGRRVPVLGLAAGAPNGRFIMNGQELGTVFCPPILDGIDGAYAVYIHGTSMEPKFEAGETAWIHPYMPVRRGDYVVAQIGSEDEGGELEGYVKQFISKTSRELTLRQFNPGEGETELMTFPAERVFSVHKIVFHQLV